MLSRVSRYLYQHPRLVLLLLLGPPLVYMGIVYLGSLFSLLINSFFYLEEFTGLIVREFTLQTYAQLFLILVGPLQLPFQRSLVFKKL